MGVAAPVVLIALFASCVSTPVVPNLQSVTHADIRGGLAARLCATPIEHEGSVFLVDWLGDNSAACRPPNPTATGPAIVRAYQDAAIFLASPAAPACGLDAPSGETADQRTVALRKACLADAHFLATMLPRVERELAHDHIVCSDCPPAPTIEERRGDWGTVLLYIRALVWAVRLSHEEQVASGATDPFAVYVCAGTNGLKALGLDDGAFQTGVFVAIVQSERALELIDAHSRSAMDATEGVSMGVREAAIRNELSKALAADGEFKREICRGLQRNRADLGLSIDGCEP